MMGDQTAEQKIFVVALPGSRNGKLRVWPHPGRKVWIPAASLAVQPGDIIRVSTADNKENIVLVRGEVLHPTRLALGVLLEDLGAGSQWRVKFICGSGPLLEFKPYCRPNQPKSDLVEVRYELRNQPNFHGIAPLHEALILVKAGQEHQVRRDLLINSRKWELRYLLRHTKDGELTDAFNYVINPAWTAFCTLLHARVTPHNWYLLNPDAKKWIDAYLKIGHEMRFDPLLPQLAKLTQTILPNQLTSEKLQSVIARHVDELRALAVYPQLGPDFPGE